MPVDKEILLKGFLGQLPDDVVSRLAKAVEVDRLIGGNALPHDEILKALRPQLRGTALRARRIPTPQRLFCRPFEDLLVSGERKVKQKGRIARSSVEVVWKWLASALMPARHNKLTTSLGEAIVAANDEQIERDLAALWSEASAALKAALADESRKAVAAETLGGPAVAEDAAEMALLLAQAQTVIEIRTRLPKPVVQLTQDDVWFLCDMVDRLADDAPDFAPYVALVVLGRLERPWEVLRLITAISRQATDIAISGTDMDIVGELLFSDLDAYAANIQSARPINFDPDVVLASSRGFHRALERHGERARHQARRQMGPAARQGSRRRRADHGEPAPARAEGNPGGAAPSQGIRICATAAEPRSVQADRLRTRRQGAPLCAARRA